MAACGLALVAVSLPSTAAAGDVSDWFVVVVNAGPSGADGVNLSLEAAGRTTGHPIVLGTAMSDGESTLAHGSELGPGGVRIAIGGGFTQAEFELAKGAGAGGE